jgi:hypothetical protein
LRAETSVTVKWIAQQLQMCTWTHLSHLLNWRRVKPQNETDEDYNTRNRPFFDPYSRFRQRT